MTQLEETMQDLNNSMSRAARDGAAMVHITRGCASRILFFLRQLDGDKTLDTSKLLMHLNDLQLANAPFEESGTKEPDYQKGVYDGLELAFQSVKEWMKN